MKEIKLTKGYVAMVDDDDHEKLSKHKWHLTGNYKKGGPFYASRNAPKEGGYRHILMHREILGVIDSDVSCDHIDRNGLNNTKANLRICTHADNQRNRRVWGSSKYKGVCKIKGTDAYKVSINVVGKAKYIGTYYDEIEAAFAYDRAALGSGNPFFEVNFPKYSGDYNAYLRECPPGKPQSELALPVEEQKTIYHMESAVRFLSVKAYANAAGVTTASVYNWLKDKHIEYTVVKGPYGTEERLIDARTYPPTKKKIGRPKGSRKISLDNY